MISDEKKYSRVLPFAKNPVFRQKMPESRDNFGERLSDLMASNGLTPITLAHRMNVSSDAVRRWRRSADCRMNVSQLIAMSEIFRVRMRWLATGSGDSVMWSAPENSELEVLRQYRRMDKQHRDLFVSIGSLLARKASGKS